MTLWNPIRRSAMHHKHLALGASMVERDGWQQPARYESVEEEVEHLRQRAGICDISPMGKLIFKGEELDHLLTPAFSGALRMDVGSVARTTMGSGSGPTPVVLARLAPDELLALTAPVRASTVIDILEEDAERCAHVLDISSGLAGVRVCGPKSGLLLGQILALDVSTTAFADLRCAQTQAAEIHVTLLRMDLENLPSYELYFQREFGEYMWDVLTKAGQVCAASPVGIDAMSGLLA